MVSPDFDGTIIARRRNQARNTGIPLRAVNVLRVRVLHTTDQTEGRLVLIRIALLAEDADYVITAGRDNEAGPLAPVHVVDGPGMIARQSANALPDRLVVRCRNTHLVARLVLLPEFQGFVVAAGHQSVACVVERQAPDGGSMRGKGRHADPVAAGCVLLEDLYRVVVARRCEDVLFWVPPHLQIFENA